MNDRTKQITKRILLALCFVFVLSASKLSQQTPCYMVRTVLLEQQGDIYYVGVLYQDPQAAANSADVQAPFTLATGQGKSLLEAFQDLAQGTQGEFSYQLSDAILLCSHYEKDALASYALQVQQTQYGCYRAQISYCDQSIAALADWVTKDPQFGESLFETLSEVGDYAPKLYQIEQETLGMPFFRLSSEGEFAAEDTLYLLAENPAAAQDAIPVQLYRLLSSAAEPCYFTNQETAFRITHRVFSDTGCLKGVTTEPAVAFGTAQSTAQAEAQQPQTTRHLYAVVSEATDPSLVALVQLELYLESIANTNAALLEQLGVERVEIHLFSLWNG